MRAAVRRFAIGLARGAGVVLVVAVMSLVLLHHAPGDPLAASLDGPSVPPAVRAAWKAQNGDDQPLASKVGTWLTHAADGDLGFSASTGMPVAGAIGAALPYTALLGTAALLAGFALGTLLALAQARAAGRALDRWLGALGLTLWALPEFIVGVLLIEWLSARLGWLPAGGAADVTLGRDAPVLAIVLDRLRHLALPAVTLALVIAAQVARHQRVGLLEAWREPFVRAARARGVDERTLWRRHAWRAALGPTIALAGLALPLVAGGAFVVEQVFAWPGMGSLAFHALANRDAHLALGCVVLGALVVVIAGALADAAQAAVDPRQAR